MKERGFKTLIATSAMYAGLSGSSILCADGSADVQQLQRGRYIAQIGGCNDCHTAGYLMNNGDIPEQQWLMGDSYGWSGPGGPSYASNLRLFVADMDEETWVETAKTLKRLPPMPWFNLNAMNEAD